MRLLRIALLSFSLLFAATAQAAPVEQIDIGLKDVIDTVEKSYRALEDVTADFFQRSLLAREQREMRADGTMALKMATSNSPLMFNFEYFRPTNHQIISNGRTMWTYLPQNRQVILSDVSFVFNPFRFDPDRDRASNFLQGLGRISKDFLINFPYEMRDMDGNFKLELTPRRASATIKQLFIVVHRDAVMNYVRKNRTIVYNPTRHELNFPVLSTTVIDHNDNSTTMEFSNIRTNRRLSDSLFDFIIPAGVDVVRPPKSGAMPVRP